MTTETSTATEAAPGYRVDPVTGAWMSLPWPADLAELPPSLGPGVIRWAEANLVHHLTGEPWRFTFSQRRFLHLWYALRPDGKWLYRSGVRRGAKGTGKDPLGAAYCIGEMAGPVRFAGWDEKGSPIGEPHRLALVQIAANSEAQAQDLMRVANAMVSNDLADEIGWDGGITRSLMASGSRLEILTASERSSEGDPATAIVLNESHHMTEASGGHRIAGVARRNVAKSPQGLARLLELTNAHEEGGASVAEETYNAWQMQVAGKTRAKDILYDSVEARPGVNLADEEELMAGLAASYKDAPWIDRERIRDEVWDPRVPPEDSVRYYLNAIAARKDAWCDPGSFGALSRPEEKIEPGDAVALFFDGSKSDDSTGVVASRISDGFCVTVGVWQRPHGERGKGWLAPREQVDEVVREAFDRWNVVVFFGDPSPATDDDTAHNYWMPMLDAWHTDFRDRLLIWASPGVGGHSICWDMRMSTPGGRERNRQFTEAAMRSVVEIEQEQTLLHDGNPILIQHVSNARRRPNLWGYSMGKESRDSSKKIDLAVCMVGARLARRQVMLSGKSAKKKRTGKVWG